MALQSAVQPFGYGSGGRIRSSPGRAEVGQVLAELVEVTEIAGVDRDALLAADLRQFTDRGVRGWWPDAGFGRLMGCPLAGVGQIDRDGAAGLALLDALEAGTGDRGGGAGCRALSADSTACVRVLFDAQPVRISRIDQRGEFVRRGADSCVVQVGGRAGKPVGRFWAGQAAVDEQCAVDTSLHPSVVDFVVEGEPVAELTNWMSEVGGLLVGVGAVDDGDAGREAEVGQRFEGGHGACADALVWGVQDQAERQVGEGADSRAGAGGDGEGGAVAVGGSRRPRCCRGTSRSVPGRSPVSGTNAAR